MQCNYQNCHANALHDGDGRCFFHTEIPAIVANRNASRSAGGKAQRKRDSVREAIAQAQDAMQQLAAGKMNVDRAKIICRLAELIIYGKESSDLQGRLNEITGRKAGPSRSE